MNLKTSQLRDAVALALFAGVSLPAIAQTADSDSTNAKTLNRVEVTGSRIRLTETETSQPVQIISHDQILKQGGSSVGEILSQISASGSALNSNFNNGGDGSASIDLRNLGASRTLVLVNGRRWVSTEYGRVDLNTIPSAIIERIEILKDGASSVYGSDALSGVVNLITRANFQGGEVNATYSQYGQGDGQHQTIDGTFGTNRDRGNAVISFSHAKEDPVWAKDRPVSAEPTYGSGSSLFSRTSPSGTIFKSKVDPTSHKVLPSSPDQVLPTTAVGAGLASNPYYPLNQYRPFTRDYTYNYATANYLTTPQQRDSIYGQGVFDITSNVHFKFDALYNRRQSSQHLAGSPLNSYNANTLLSGSSYFNPYNKLYGGDGRDISFGHRLAERERIMAQDAKTAHIYAGINGTFAVATHTFDWDVGGSLNRTESHETTIGDPQLSHLRQAVGPSAVVGGVVRCVDASGQPIAGCVPFNPLSPAGHVPKDQLDYLLFTGHNKYVYRNQSITANISGNILQLPAGPLSFATGVEHRKESGNTTPDPIVARGDTMGNASGPIRGSYSLNDYYLELLAPILKDKTLAKNIDLSLAARYSDYSTFGSTTNYKIGLKWNPIEQVLVRGSYATGFRAPTIKNLYAGSADTFPIYSDPCSSNDPNYAKVAAACQAAGVPSNFTATYGSASSGARSGQTNYRFTETSNPNLKPETAKNYTFGLVFSPSSLSGLDLSLDWWRIDIKNAIFTPDTNFILQQCYEKRLAGFCQLLTRDSTGSVNNVFLKPINYGEVRVEGVDLGANYTFAESALGKFKIGSQSTYVYRRKTLQDKSTGWDSDNGYYESETPYWRFRSEVDLDWSRGNLLASWTAHFYSSLKDKADGFVDNHFTHIASALYNDVQLGYHLPWNGTVRVGVDNVLDRNPPTARNSMANSFDEQYPLPGRVYSLKYNQRF